MSRPAGWGARPAAAFTTTGVKSRRRRADSATHIPLCRIANVAVSSPHGSFAFGIFHISDTALKLTSAGLFLAVGDSPRRRCGDDTRPPSNVAGRLSGPRSQCRLSAFELLSLVLMELAGRDKGGLPRPREHRVGI
ncbi:hypothetical protein CHELA1G11_10821 [Hyphomicrobiales bacterium]|nr:hypothetical protein CHELA1G11_10821 [Hyphomicrobiales bacterium]CAH1672026.1 hypothetical protein CHELA1G2_13487 [Hyphomicrobiales bacterium]